MKKATSWKELTLREKIGQTVISLCETDTHIKMCGSIKGFAERYPIGPLEFWGEDAMSIWASNCCDKSKTVVVSFGSPYLYKYYQNSRVTYINAYSSIKATVSAFVKAMFGDSEFSGKSSVTL